MIGREAGVTWLCAHEIRLQRRNQQLLKSERILVTLLAAFMIAGVCFVLLVRRQPFAEDLLMSGGGIVALFLFLIFLANALVSTARIISSANGLQLMMTAPIPMRRIIAVKLIGVTGALIIGYGLPVTMLLLPFAVSVQPSLLGAILILPFLALAAASTALTLVALLYRLAGGARAQSYANIAAALTAAVFFGLFLLLRENLTENTLRSLGGIIGARSSVAATFFILPGRTASGDGSACLIIVASALALGALATTLAQWAFKAGVEQSDNRNAARRGTGHAKLAWLSSGPLGAVMLKDMRTLARDPELLFKLGLRAAYAAPLAFIVLRGRESDPFVFIAGIAFVLGQLTSSLGWLLHSAEALPDLIAHAPLPPKLAVISKLLTSMLPSLLFALVSGAAILARSPALALCLILTTVLVALGAGTLEAVSARPSSRAAFLQNRDLNFAHLLLTISICAALASAGAWAGQQIAGAGSLPV